MIAGLAAYFAVDVRELPDVDRPVISVVTDFKNAAAQTVDREVTRKVEKALSRIAGIKTISSRSSYGRSRVVMEFNNGVDLNAAASDIRDVVSRLVRTLPSEATAPTIIKADSNASSIMLLAVTSDSTPIEDLSILVDDQIISALASVDGVADVQENGARDKVFRIEIDQAKLASYGLTIADIAKALHNMSFDAPVGTLRSARQTLTVRALSSLQTVKDFENLYVNPHVRLRDVAHVFFGKDIENSIVRVDGKVAIGLGIIRQARSNSLEISRSIHKVVEQLNQSLPKDVHVSIISDDALFIKGALHEVEIALFIAIISVIGVIFLFLRDFRATLIPAISIPVAMIGTVSAIYLAGFSLNILTLLAFVLATGLVVDDAIVVLENIVRRKHEGIGVSAAAILGTKEVFFAVLATTFTLVAIFIPISFLPGQAGGLFREFGFVLAISILLSSFVALTLCPMLASKFLRASDDKAKSFRIPFLARLGNFGSFANRFHKFYVTTLQNCLNHPWRILSFCFLLLTLSFFIYKQLPNELTPKEDRAQIYLSMRAPQGVSIDYFNRQMSLIESKLDFWKKKGIIEHIYSVSGTGGATNSGFMMITLAPWESRKESQQTLVKEIRRELKDIIGLKVFAFEGNSLNIRGAGQGLRFAILGNDYDTLLPAANQLIAKMQSDKGKRFLQPRLGVDVTQPQLFLHINRLRAMDLGIDIDYLRDLLQAMLNGYKIGSIYIGDRAYDVKLASKPGAIKEPLDLKNLFMKTKEGRFVSLSTIAHLEEKSVPPQVDRESRMRAVTIASGLSNKTGLAEAYQTVLQLSESVLPKGSYIIPLSEAASLKETSSGFVFVFAFAVLIILLILAAQFESFILALIIMATIPLGVSCALFSLYFTNGTLNIYSEIGLVLLVGIIAKNGILIVEFADQLREKGYTIRRAIEEASAVRLRPVLMTMLCAVFGAIPLILAHGAGAEARISLGWVIVGGLGLATLATLYVTPVAYFLLGRFLKTKTKALDLLEEELKEAAQKE